MENVLAERLTHSTNGVKCSVSVEAVCWEALKSNPKEGLPTPWEILTEDLTDLLSDILVTHIPPHDVPKYAYPMAREWVERFGRVG